MAMSSLLRSLLKTHVFGYAHIDGVTEHPKEDELKNAPEEG